MIHAWLLDYRPLAQPVAGDAAAAAAILPARLETAMREVDGPRPEWALLSTCHRCEVYSHPAHAEWLRGVLREHFPPAARSALTAVREGSAARHLMRVAAGLDSMLLGETDVQRQVAAALARATEAGSAGPVLNALFGAAVHAGKRVRTETGIARHATSLASAAVDLVAARLASAGRARAVVFGAGTMARRACERLHAVGIGSLTVVNRTMARAERLADTHGGRAVPWSGAAEALREADIAIAATAAPEPFIAPPMLSGVAAARAGRPLHLVDLALPPNVRPGACDAAGVHCYDFADLEEATRASHAARAAEVPGAEAIIDQELAHFLVWLREHEVAPALRLLGELAAATRDDELERAWRRLPELDARQRRVVQTLAHNIARRLVRRPMLHLREAAGSHEANRYRQALEYLFADPDNDEVGGAASPDG
ncbi:MAG: glutamyl-tRNA reductase [Spirochaetaceae bacterium]|nr:glutamyl-tRNA reductase [Spirochaetaceae bacterium]